MVNGNCDLIFNKTRSFGSKPEISVGRKKIFAKLTTLVQKHETSVFKNTKFRVGKTKFRFKNPKLRFKNHEVLVQKPEVSVRKPEVSIQNPEVSGKISVKVVILNASEAETQNFELLCIRTAPFLPSKYFQKQYM
jgi:hypothetical protein